MKLAVIIICKLTQIQIVSSFTIFNPYKSKKTETDTKIETILNMQKAGVTNFCRFCDQIPQKDYYLYAQFKKNHKQSFLTNKKTLS